MRVLGLLMFISFTALIFTGCTTTRTSNTSRTGVEQLLISNAVDQTLAKTSLPEVDGRKVFLEDKYLEGVDKSYVVGSMRQKLLKLGASLVEKKEESDLTVEMCSGGIGTDNVESFLGMPGLTVPGLPVELPEVRLYEQSSQYGTAKISVVTYDTEAGSLIMDAGTTLARADDSRWNLLGVGPFHTGSVRDEVVGNTGDVDLTSRVANVVNFDTTKH